MFKCQKHYNNYDASVVFCVENKLGDLIFVVYTLQF